MANIVPQCLTSNVQWRTIVAMHVADHMRFMAAAVLAAITLMLTLSTAAYADTSLGLPYGGCFSDTPISHELYGWCWVQDHRVQQETRWLPYTVRRGDTLWGIAKRFTGSGRNWRMISDVWADRPGRLRVGEDLIVPTFILV